MSIEIQNFVYILPNIWPLKTSNSPAFENYPGIFHHDFRLPSLEDTESQRHFDHGCETVAGHRRCRWSRLHCATTVRGVSSTKRGDPRGVWGRMLGVKRDAIFEAQHVQEIYIIVIVLLGIWGWKKTNCTLWFISRSLGINLVASTVKSEDFEIEYIWHMNLTYKRPSLSVFPYTCHIIMLGR